MNNSDCSRSKVWRDSCNKFPKYDQALFPDEQGYTMGLEPKDWNIISACKFRIKKIDPIIILSILAGICLVICYLFIKESWTASLYASDYSVLEKLIPEESIDYCGLDAVECYYENKDYISNYIKEQFVKEGLDGDMGVKLADCESYLDPTLSYVNKNGTIDRGLFMFNSKWHPEITDKCSYDFKCATTEAIKLIKKSGWTQWACYKKIK